MRLYLKNRSLLKSLLPRRLVKDEEGATAIEFAVLAIPFFLMLFGIIELAVIFFINSNLQNASYEAARRIRTGEFTGNEAQLKTLICTQMNPDKSGAQLDTCRGRIEVRVKLIGDFSKTTKFAPPEPTPPPGTPPPANVEGTNGGDTVILTAPYRHPLAVPGDFSRLSNVADGNHRDIKVVSAFRNEPF